MKTMATLLQLLLGLQASVAAVTDVSASVVHLDMPRSRIPTAAADARAIVLPVLFDFQPALLQLSTSQSIAAQLRRFCVQHGLDSGRCGTLLQQAMDELIELHGDATYCKRMQQQDVQSLLPALLHVKNVLLAPSTRTLKPPTFSWLHDKAANLASDLCGFLRSARRLDADASLCESPLQGAFDGSFQWISALPQCQPETGNALNQADTSERVFTIEQIGASLRSGANATELDPKTIAGSIMGSFNASPLELLVSSDESESRSASIGSNQTNRVLNNSAHSTESHDQEAPAISLAEVSQPVIELATPLESHTCLRDSEMALLLLAPTLICDKSDAVPITELESSGPQQADVFAASQDHDEGVHALGMSARVADAVFFQASELAQEFRCDGNRTRGNGTNDTTSAGDGSPNQQHVAAVASEVSIATTASAMPELTQPTGVAAPATSISQ